MKRYEKLFEPGMIGNIRTKNRAVMASMGCHLAEANGAPGERLIRYYEERAKGGIGMINVEATGIDDINNFIKPHELSLAHDGNIPEFELLADTIHKYDVPGIVQLYSTGCMSEQTPAGVWALSDVPFKPGLPAYHAMTREEIHIIEERFIAAAKRAKKAGFDGVELHGAHNYLLLQLLTPYYNTREDEYGGSIENRCRMFGEIIEGIRAECGSRFPVNIRFPGDQFTPNVPGTYGLEEGIAIAKELERLGATALNISNGNSFNPNANCEPYSYDPGWKSHVSKAIKEAVSIPVLATGTVRDADTAEKMLEEGASDFVVMGRSQICDPEFMNKAKRGDIIGTRKCIGCLFCRERLYADMPIYCSVNPRMGWESKYPKNPAKDGNGRKVAVIGGGPAGMESAIVMQSRGFDVTLFEKDEVLGGSLNLADKADHKDKITKLTETMCEEVKRLGVDVRLGCSPSREDMIALKPEGIILAAGAAPVVPKMPGIDRANVVTSHEVLSDQVKVSGKVAIIGSGMTGLECAEKLAAEGCQFSIVEMQDNIGPGMFPIILEDTMSRIRPAGPEIYVKHALKAITEQGVLLHSLEEDIDKEIEADYVVLSLGVSPRKELMEKYGDICDHMTVVGDNNKGGTIAKAMRYSYFRTIDFMKD